MAIDKNLETHEVSNMVNAHFDESHVRMATALGSVNEDEETDAITTFLIEAGEEIETTDQPEETPPNTPGTDCTDCEGDAPCDECADADKNYSTIINASGEADQSAEKEKRKDLIKYGAIAAAAIVLVILAIKFWK